MKEPGWPRGNRPPHRVAWELWKAGKVMRCEMNPHPLGHELRLYVADEFQSSQVFPTIGDAEGDADDRKREFLAAGWSVRRPMPD
jgi:hypothetical protein